MNDNVDKLWKQTVREQEKRIKPGECQKYIRMVIDAGFMKGAIGAQLLKDLNDNPDIKYDIRNLNIPNTILWERNAGQLRLEMDSNTGLGDEWQLERQVMRVLSESEFKYAVKDNTLEELGINLREKYPDMSYTFIVPLLKDTNRTIEKAIVELLILQDMNVVQLHLDKPNELLTQLGYYTKAIAELPYKKKREETVSSFKKYLANDNKQCVRIENGNGYGRLWQQHLTRLPMVTIEVADAIIGAYPCPRKMLDHFEKDPEAVNFLANLKIKRSGAAAALQGDRRIGHALANKLYRLYMSRDPDEVL